MELSKYWNFGRWSNDRNHVEDDPMSEMIISRYSEMRSRCSWNNRSHLGIKDKEFNRKNFRNKLKQTGQLQVTDLWFCNISFTFCFKIKPFFSFYIYIQFMSLFSRKYFKHRFCSINIRKFFVYLLTVVSMCWVCQYHTCNWPLLMDLMYIQDW